MSQEAPGNTDDPTDSAGITASPGDNNNAPVERRDLTREFLLPLLQKRTPLQHIDVPFIVCWSQKSGCTSVLKWFLYHAGLLDDALQHQELNLNLEIHNYENNVLKARPGYKDDLVDQLLAGKPVIKFLRCPYERLFSSYMHLNNVRFLLLQKEGQSTPGMLLRQSILDFIHGKAIDIGHPISFGEYLLWMKEQDPMTVDPHHAPQCAMLDDRVPATYYRLENFDHSLTHLERKFSLRRSSAVRTVFSSIHHHQKRRSSRAEALRFLQGPPPLIEFSNTKLPKITAALLEKTEFDPLVRQLFAKDIAQYNSIDPIRWYEQFKPLRKA
jgi:hypothetical protein